MDLEIKQQLFTTTDSTQQRDFSRGKHVLRENSVRLAFSALERDTSSSLTFFTKSNSVRFRSFVSRKTHFALLFQHQFQLSHAGKYRSSSTYLIILGYCLNREINRDEVQVLKDITLHCIDCSFFLVLGRKVTFGAELTNLLFATSAMLMIIVRSVTFFFADKKCLTSRVTIIH